MRVLGEEETAALVSQFEARGPAFRSLQRYVDFLQEVDREVHLLEERHRAHLRCAPGCDTCCRVSRTVLPIEALRLWLALQQMPEGWSKPRPRRRECPLLLDHRCMLYPARPVLCRTHGLPLLYIVRDQPTVSFCPLNFRDWPHAQFRPEQVLDMEQINATLFSINREFVLGELQSKFRDTDRVRLWTLLELSPKPSPTCDPPPRPDSSSPSTPGDPAQP